MKVRSPTADILERPPYWPQTLTCVGDFHPAEFTIYAYCGACDHSAAVDPDKVGRDVEVRTLTSRLRCAECGSWHCSIRIVYTGADEFEYREG